MTEHFQRNGALIRRCQSFRRDGGQCGAPAVTNEATCLAHATSPELQEKMRLARQRAGEVPKRGKRSRITTVDGDIEIRSIQDVRSLLTLLLRMQADDALDQARGYLMLATVRILLDAFKVEAAMPADPEKIGKLVLTLPRADNMIQVRFAEELNPPEPAETPEPSDAVKYWASRGHPQLEHAAQEKPADVEDQDRARREAYQREVDRDLGQIVRRHFSEGN